jgi:DNA uptake protein ComE-like DNA-binding protein
MKKISFGPLKEWFGYTRRERRSSFILLIIISAVAGIRLIVPGKNMTVEIMPVNSIEEITDTITGKVFTDGYQVNYHSMRADQIRKKLDINSCDSASLEALPGLGPVLSARIIKYRNLLGGFASVNQLREVYGLSEETFNLVSGMLEADSADVTKININDADYKKLIRLPYFERYDVAAILKYRELKGRVEGIEELVENKLITGETASRVRPYMEF